MWPHNCKVLPTRASPQVNQRWICFKKVNNQPSSVRYWPVVALVSMQAKWFSSGQFPVMCMASVLHLDSCFSIWHGKHVESGSLSWLWALIALTHYCMCFYVVCVSVCVCYVNTVTVVCIYRHVSTCYVSTCELWVNTYISRILIAVDINVMHACLLLFTCDWWRYISGLMLWF